MKITEKAPTAEVLTKKVAKIKKIYADGRRVSLKEEEYKKILQ